MCVIVHQPKGAQLDKETCRLLWKRNPDGGGFAFISDDNQLVTKKFMSFGGYWNAFETARSANPNRDFMLHMRLATHGSIRIENVHPFPVGDDVLMSHNGIIHGVPEYEGDDRTDTEVFISDVLPELPLGWQDRPYLVEMVENWLGWSKLMFLNTSPLLEKTVYRMGDWDEFEGMYLSNLEGLESQQMLFGYRVDASGGKYYESSDDWNEWMEMQAREPVDKEGLKEDLYVARNNQHINHEIIEMEGDLECFGCSTVIDVFTAECECWNLVCEECWQMVAKCDLKGDCYAAYQSNYASLNREDKQRVSNAIRNEAKKSPVYAQVVELRR